MKKILVTTDLSDKSKAGIRFAIQLSLQNKYTLTFFHAFHILTPTAWYKSKVEDYQLKESLIVQKKMEAFIGKIYKEQNKILPEKSCITKSSVFPHSAVMDYAAQHKYSFICMSTRGAGKFQRIFGTNASNIINQSDVPVIVVPYNHRTGMIKSILYSSDLLNLQNELKKVVAFASPLDATVELLHFTSPPEKVINKKTMEAAAKKFAKYDIKLNIENTDFIKNLVGNIQAAIKKTKPSMMIMFTEQNRSLFQKLFLGAKSAEYSFDAKIPLLVFNKS